MNAHTPASLALRQSRAQGYNVAAHELIYALLSTVEANTSSVVGESEAAPTTASADSSLELAAQASLSGTSKVGNESLHTRDAGHGLRCEKQ